MIEKLKKERSKAIKVLADRHREYNESVLGFGYALAKGRLDSAIAHYKDIDSKVRGYNENNLK